MCGCLSHAPTGDLAHDMGMCPDWESNQQPFGSQARAQSTELHQLWQFLLSLKSYKIFYSLPLFPFHLFII